MLSTTLEFIPPRVATSQRLALADASTSDVLHLVTDRGLTDLQLVELSKEMSLRLGRETKIHLIDDSQRSVFNETMDYFRIHETELSHFDSEIPPPVSSRRGLAIAIGYERRDHAEVTKIVKREFCVDFVQHVENAESAFGLIACIEQPVGAIAISPFAPRHDLAELYDCIRQKGVVVKRLSTHTVLNIDAERDHRLADEIFFPSVEKPSSWRIQNPLSAFFARSAGIALLVIASPLILAIAAAIGLTSGRPTIYSQSRVGYNGKKFRILKFRTMSLHAQNDNGPEFVLKDDPRITTVGHWLRKTSLDELPQLINIAIGDMALIGHRPMTEQVSRLLSEKIEGFDVREHYLPGIVSPSHFVFAPDKRLEDFRLRLFVDMDYQNTRTWTKDMRLLLGAGLFVFGASHSFVLRVSGLLDYAKWVEQQQSWRTASVELRDLFAEFVEGDSCRQIASRKCDIYLES